jgi:hypothetical protein
MAHAENDPSRPLGLAWRPLCPAVFATSVPLTAHMHPPTFRAMSSALHHHVHHHGLTGRGGSRVHGSTG